MEGMVKTRITYSSLQKHYQGKNVFVTGHTGFKGSWFIKILHDLGAFVRGYSLAPEDEFCLYSQMKGDELCDSVLSDIRDRYELQKALIDFKPDFVFHFAAQPLVRKSYLFPVDTFEVNSMGTLNLLESLRALDMKCSIILITTDKVYLNKELDYYYKETDSLGGYDPYSASKACAEMLIDSYRNCFFNTKDYDSHLKGIAVARAGNVIGGGDWAKDRLIPDVVRSLQSDSEIVIRNQSSIRPWQHVIEPLFGYLELGVKLLIDPIQFGQAFNFGPNKFDNLTVEEVVTEAIKYWESGSYRIQQSIENYHEASLLKLDISKALLHLNWKPVFDSSTSIERTISWYKKFYSGISVLELMNSDIEFYLEKSNE
jgi:CDP-glucose 4,6-dehydratase